MNRWKYNSFLGVYTYGDSYVCLESDTLWMAVTKSGAERTVSYHFSRAAAQMTVTENLAFP